MKFVILKAYRPQKERVMLGENRIIYDYITLGFLKEYNSFDIDDETIIVNETDSNQLRPKAIYQNKKGFYYIEKGRTTNKIYLDNIDEIETAIKKFKKYLENNLEKILKGEK